MAKARTADTLIAEISDSIRNELIGAIAPIVRRIAEAAANLESAIGGRRRGGPGRKPGRPAGSRGPGRPPKSGRGPGRPPKVKVGRPKGSGKKGARTPRGAMKQTILDVLAKAGAPMKLSGIRDAILQVPAYRGRNEKALYTQIVITIKKITEIVRTPKGEYALKGKK